MFLYFWAKENNMKTKNTTLRQKLAVITINSTAYFMLAYIAFIVLINFISLLMANFFYDVGGTLYHYGFDLNTQNFEWSLESVVLIFFIGVLVALLFAVYFQILYKSIRRVTDHWKLFLLWFYLIAYTVFLGDIIIGAFVNYMTGAFFNFMFTPMFLRVIIGILGLIALIVIGVNSAKNVLISLNIYLKKASIPASRPFILAQILYPFLIGNLIIFLLKIPQEAKFGYIDTFVLLSMFVIIAAIIFKSNTLSSINFSRHTDSFKIRSGPVIIAIIAILLFRFGLGMGISIG
jgi:hypothetical protein